jgi:hypothetical protein
LLVSGVDVPDKSSKATLAMVHERHSETRDEYSTSKCKLLSALTFEAEQERALSYFINNKPSLEGRVD